MLITFNLFDSMMPGTPEPHSSLSEQRAGRFSMEQSPGFNNPQTPTSAASTKCGQGEFYHYILRFLLKGICH